MQILDMLGFGKRTNEQWLRTLGTSPGKITLSGTIASRNEIVSPLTDLRANAFVWQFSARTHELGPLRRNQFPQQLETFSPCGTRQWGGPMVLQVEGGLRVRVPWRALELSVHGMQGEGMPLECPLPGEIAPVTGKGVLFFSEIPFVEGDEVTLEGWIERPPSEDPYRAEGGDTAADFVVRPDLGAVTLTQRLVDMVPWHRRLLMWVWKGSYG